MSSCSLIRRIILGGAIGLLVLVAMASLVYPFRCIPWNIMICGPNEGWNAYYQDAAVNGGVLYPYPDQLITNNYPPLSFYAVGLVGKLLGDPIVAGRWMAFISLLLIAFFISKIIQILGGQLVSGVIGASFFLAIMGLFFERYVGMNDPQLLAQALMTVAFFVFLKALQKQKSGFIGIALMVVAGFFKQNIIVLPLSTFLWLLQRKEQRAFLKYFLYATVLIAIGFGCCYFLYGYQFFFNFLTPRRFFVKQDIAALLDLQSLIIALIMSVAILWRHRKERNIALVLMMLAVGLGAHLLQRSGSGVDSNSQFGLNIAVGIAVGMAFQRLVDSSTWGMIPCSRLLWTIELAFVGIWQRFHHSRYQKVMLILLPRQLPKFLRSIIQIIHENGMRLRQEKIGSGKKEYLPILFLILLLMPLLLAPGMRLVARGFSSHFVEEAKWREQCMNDLIEKVKTVSGDVITEPYVSYRAGKPFLLDGFNLEERLETGKLPIKILFDRVEHGQVTKIPVDLNAIWPYDDFNFIKLKFHFQDWPNAANRIP